MFDVRVGGLLEVGGYRRWGKGNCFNKEQRLYFCITIYWIRFVLNVYFGTAGTKCKVNHG